MIFGRVVNLIPSDKHPIQLGVAKIKLFKCFTDYNLIFNSVDSFIDLSQLLNLHHSSLFNMKIQKKSNLIQ